MERNFTDIMFIIVSILTLIISICMAVLLKDFDRIKILNSTSKIFNVSECGEIIPQGVKYYA